MKKRLNDILKEKVGDINPIAGDLAQSLARTGEILQMADDIYNTLGEMDSIDQDVEQAIESAYSTLDDVWVMIDTKYDIVPSPKFDMDNDGDFEDETF